VEFFHVTIGERKEGLRMPTKDEIIVVQKATVYDIKRILKENPGKTYTEEEINQILDAYITSVER
jgi:hypothetical protein